MIDPLIFSGLKPGLADKMQMAKAVAESDAAADQMELQQVMKTSEDDEIQRAIKESKLSAEHVSRDFFSLFFPLSVILSIFRDSLSSFLMLNRPLTSFGFLFVSARLTINPFNSLTEK